MADGCITEYAILELFEKISADKLHTFKVGIQRMNLINSEFFNLFSNKSNIIFSRELYLL